MKYPKSVRESLSKEKLEQAEKMILSAEGYRLRRLMRAMLSMTYDELDLIEQILNSIDDSK